MTAPIETLIAAVQELSFARDLEGVMRVVRRAARALTGADGATFVLREGDTCYYADEDAIGPLWKGRRFPASACVSGWAMDRATAVVIEDITADPRIPLDLYKPTFVKSMAMMPIRRRAPVGAVGVYWAGLHAASGEELSMLQALCDSTAVAMENVELYALLARPEPVRASQILSLHAATGYVVAVVATLASVGLWTLLPVRAGEIIPFSLFLLIVGLSGVTGGLWPGLFATGLGSLSAVFASTPRYQWRLPAPSDAARLGLFIVSGVLLTLLCARLRRSIRESHADRAALATAYADLARTSRTESARLEHLVDLRTAELARAEQRLAALLAGERAARSDAERASRMKDELVATMSHELRTPLNAIVGWTQLLDRGDISPDKLSRGLVVIRRNTTALTQILSDMLDMSRIVAGKLRVDLQPSSLSAIVGEALESFADAARAKRIEIRMALDEAQVMADPTRLSQVVWNLVSNAIKFTPEGGGVDVSIRAGADQAVLRVADSGCGIEPAFLPFVFDRFRQQDTSRTRRHGGLGLGLSIVKHLVDLHGGTVSAANRADASGAVLTVTLPVVPDPTATSEAQAAASARADAEAISGLRVLVVDDDADAREVVRGILEDHGAVVSTAPSAAAAIEAIPGLRPDVLVSDIGMPDIDGYELVRRLRTSEEPGAAKGLPAVALTAYARPEDRDAALSAGFAAHVPKPIDAVELVTAVKAAAAHAA